MVRRAAPLVRRRLWLRLVVWLSMWICAASGIAQQATNPPAGEKPSTPAPGLKPGAEDVVQLLGVDGKPILIPRSETWEAFQKFLKSRPANDGPAAPPFSVIGAEFEGSSEANDDSVTLNATLTISVNRDDEDVLVPLRLNEATLLKKPDHSGPNEAEFDKFDPEAGYRCWLRGKGQHELKMTLAVAINKKQGAARRLILRLPETPGHSIKLNVPLPKVSAKGLDRSHVRTKSLDNGRTEIQAFGPSGSLLDLSWQSINDASESKPELQVRSLIVAELRADSLVLEATQTVGVLQGTFDKFTVQLPAEFELLEVSGPEVKESAKLAGSPARVAVTLTAPTSTPVVLKWILSAKITADATTLPAIEGFEVDGARQQKGHVVLIAWDGVNLRKRDVEDRFVLKDTLSALRDVPGFHVPANGSGNTTVYRFLKQPFRMVFDVQKIEPFFSAEQNHLVRLTADHADLETTLSIRVFRGSLLDLTLPWAAYKAENWSIVSNDAPEVVEQVAVEDSPKGPQLRVRLIDRKTRSDREFELRLTTRRTIPTDGSAFELSLPYVAGSGQKASRVIVAPSSNLEVEWTPKNQASALPTTPDEKVLDLLESTRNVTAWRWDEGSPEFSATAKVQQQSIAIESQSDLTFDTRSVMVKQHLGYEVAFEPLSQARLMIPRAISDRVRFQLRDATGQLKPLPSPVFTGLEIDQARQFRLSLDPPQVGKFEVIAEFEVERISDMTSDEPSQLSLPVLQSSDAEFAATRVKWNTGEKLVATLEDPAWKPELTGDKASRWKANGAKTAITVKITSAADSALQDFTVHRALLRTVVSEGRRHSQALYELDRDVREITLTLPPGISSKNLTAWWNQSEVRVEPITRPSPAGEVEVRLRRPRKSDKGGSSPENADIDKSKGRLWLDFYSEEPTHFGWSNQHRLVAPRFASTVWVAQTIWQIVLPADQHLLTTPRDYATQFSWQRSLLWWSRQPSYGYERIGRVLNDAAPNKGDSAVWDQVASSTPFESNVYPVSCFGPPQPLIFWSMSRSAVVGCGAGLALLLGFVLIRIPATRHVLTFLLVGFAMSLMALWFAEPVKVLLQPAILGAAMAVMAAIIDRVGHRPAQTPMVTLSSPSDFFAGSDSGLRGLGAGVMAEASTAPPQIAHPIEPISGSGSGSGGRA
jgi:hypothetical protein